MEVGAEGHSMGLYGPLILAYHQLSISLSFILDSFISTRKQKHFLFSQTRFPCLIFIRCDVTVIKTLSRVHDASRKLPVVKIS